MVDGRSDGFDVIGFGALNVDCIASASRLSEYMTERVAESTARFEWNREGPVDEETVLAALDRLEAASLSYSLGGSAWLTTYTLAQLDLGLRLGYLGVVGHMVRPGLSFTGQMARLDIDSTWVGRRPERPCGLCLSYIDDTDRVMLTHPGANFEMHDHLRRNRGPIAEYLASARYVHVTSFLDPDTPAEMLNVLTDARELNPELRISLDPGYDWATHVRPAVDGLLAMTDLLFVNYREFKALGYYAHGEPDASVARKVLERCAEGCTVFVTKRYDVVETFRRSPGGVANRTFRPAGAMREAGIEDATGAGDVFSAAVLASMVSNRLQVELGAFLGLSMARYKHNWRPGTRFPFPDLSKGFLQQNESVASLASDARPRGVLLLHDAHPQWREVRDFVQNRCGLRLHDLDTTETNAAPDTASRIAAVLDRCCFAVCLLSARTGRPVHRGRTDQSVVHHTGLLHGRYGFDRVAMLAEEGCRTFSNIAGLIRLDFPEGQVNSTFHELERMLAREGLVGRGGAEGV